jgi:hypothetical protein
MNNQFAGEIAYFATEGRTNLTECLRLSLAAAREHGLSKLVIFTAQGEGVQLAIEERSSNSDLPHINLIAVTFPNGKLFKGPNNTPEARPIPEDRLSSFEAAGVKLVRARLPFDPIRANYEGHGVLGQDFSLIGNALTIFGGSMSLCVQATLMACDAGAVEPGEHVIAMSSDTSILLRAAPTERFLTDMVVREIICKPLFLGIARGEQVPPAFSEDQDSSEHEQPQLLEGDVYMPNIESNLPELEE